MVLTRGGRRPRRNVSRQSEGRSLSLSLGVGRLGRLLVWMGGLVAGMALLGSVSLGILWGYRWVTGHELFRLQRLEIRGLQRLSAEEVAALGQVREGVSVLDINIAEVRARILSNPWVREVSVTRILPDQLVIDIVERRPAFLLPRDGALQYADSDGRPIAPVTPERFVSLPVLEKDDAVGISSGMREILAALERNELPFGMHQVAWIRQDSAEQYSFVVEKPRVVVQLDGRDVAAMLETLRRLWQDLTQRGEMDKVASVFVMPGHAWVTLRR